MKIPKKFENKDILFTDGASKGNPGQSGWGVVQLSSKGEVQEFGGYEKNATNNQMELLATIKALNKVTRGSKVQIFTDSKYVKLGITEWIHNWKKNGWKTANKQQVKNKELWIKLDLLNNKFEINWNWVKAHSTDKLNNEVDLLAREAANL